MSRHFRSIGSAWRTNLAEVSARDIQPEPEMPRGQMIALLTIRGGGADSLFAKVLHCLKAVGSDEPDAADYTALREARYIQWNHQARLDVLLPPGLWAAERIAREMAFKYQIHHITISSATRRSNMGPTASCACGHFRIHASRSNEHTLPRRAAVHLASVKAGTWKPPRPISEFLDEVMPLQLPLEIPR